MRAKALGKEGEGEEETVGWKGASETGERQAGFGVSVEGVESCGFTAV